MHNKTKPKSSKGWFDIAAEAFDRIVDKLSPPQKSAEEEAESKKIMEDFYKNEEATNKALGLPPLDAKNPYRFL
ncbi:MAG: hypothetical protein JRG74_12920 [Deltaproteobacteria bacterium]|nr:hypothetical protein [Deltaproteobacteria bacterium]MBW2166953.1 hypothetical protein [Deltaproteobacteria bacterium]